MEYILAIATAILIVLGCIWWERRKHEAFKKRFPPISDAEFVQRCGPGTNPDVALRMRRIVADQLSVEYARIYPSSRFVEDLGAD